MRGTRTPRLRREFGVATLRPELAARRRRQAGFTLIEVVIATALGVLVMGALTSVVLTTVLAANVATARIETSAQVRNFQFTAYDGFAFGVRVLPLLVHDGRRRQRGSVLSGLLIIVAFLAILIGGLLTELTSSFVLSRDQMTRVKTEATVTSAVELGIHQLEGGPVPAVCAQDARGPWYLTLNGHDAGGTQTFIAHVPAG